MWLGVGCRDLTDRAAAFGVCFRRSGWITTAYSELVLHPGVFERMYPVRWQSAKIVLFFAI
jgi:hypothetical protein